MNKSTAILSLFAYEGLSLKIGQMGPMMYEYDDVALMQNNTDHGYNYENEYMHEDLDLSFLKNHEGITFEGPIYGDINIYLGDQLCGEGIDCEETMPGFDGDYDCEFDGGEHGGETGENGGEIDAHGGEIDVQDQSGAQCHYDQYFMLHDDHDNEHVSIASENGWDMIGFIADHTHFDPQDERINDDFMAYIFDIVCCEELVQSIETVMRLKEFDINGLEEHNDNNYSPQVNDAFWNARDRCDAYLWNDGEFGEFGEEDNFDSCDYWDMGDSENKPQWQIDAEDMEWDTVRFMTDFILENESRPVSDARITEDFTLEIFQIACCDDMNRSIDFMLQENGFQFNDAGMMELDNLWWESLTEDVYFSWAGNLERCRDMQKHWETWNAERPQ